MLVKTDHDASVDQTTRGDVEADDGISDDSEE